MVFVTVMSNLVSHSTVTLGVCYSNVKWSVIM